MREPVLLLLRERLKAGRLCCDCQNRIGCNGVSDVLLNCVMQAYVMPCKGLLRCDSID